MTILLLYIQNHAMTQKIELQTNGLNILEVGSKVNQITCPFLSSIETYSNGNKKLILDDTDGGKFYYINPNYVSTQSIGILDDLFVFVDATGIVRSIDIHLKEEVGGLFDTLNKVFGPQLLSSESGMNGLKMGTKGFWSRNGLNVFCSRRINLNKTEISIYKASDEKRYSVLVVNNN
jgi:hypothetical protein